MTKDILSSPTHPAANRFAAVLVAFGVVILAAMPARCESAAEPERSWVSALLEPLENLSHWVSSFFVHDERFVTEEVVRFKQMVDSDLRPFETLVQQAGFRISAISVGAELTPQIALTLDFVHRPSEPEKTTLMARITGLPSRSRARRSKLAEHASSRADRSGVSHSPAI